MCAGELLKSCLLSSVATLSNTDIISCCRVADAVLTIIVFLIDSSAKQMLKGVIRRSPEMSLA